MVFHGYAITHVDSLAHFFWEGKMYNGRPAHLVSTSLGATVESIELAKNGIVTRGVLVDAPMIRGTDWIERGDGVMPEDILAAEERCGFKIQEGDVCWSEPAIYTAATWKALSSRQLTVHLPAMPPAFPCSTNAESP
jgi:hypothetical protein